MENSNAPCEGCQERNAECHSSCSKYKRWKEHKSQEDRKCKDKKFAGYDISNFRYEQMGKICRKSRRKQSNPFLAK